MSNDESVLREVDQELAEDRQWAMFRSYGPFIIAGAIAIVGAVAGTQIWNGVRDNTAQEQSLALRNALELMDEDPVAGRDDLSALASASSTGVGVLAQFHLAASYARARDRVAAIDVYESIYTTGSTPSRLKTLARLRAAYMALADGRDTVFTHLGNLETSDDSFRFYAKEVSGLAALGESDFPTAIAIFDELRDSADAPASIAQRAREFAAHARTGQSGVSITGGLEVDSIISAISGEGVNLAPLDEFDPHAGHDHAEGEGHDHDDEFISEGGNGPIPFDAGDLEAAIDQAGDAVDAQTQEVQVDQE